MITKAAEVWTMHPHLERPVAGGLEPLMVCCARSNVAALNIAHTLSKNPHVKGQFR